MKHRLKHNQLGRNTNQEKALYRSLVSSLLEKGRVETTLAKAKAVSAIVDKVINLGKRNDANAQRQVIKILGTDRLLDEIFSKISPSKTDRNSGYSRIIKLGPRFSDSSEMVFLELVEGQTIPQPVESGPKVVSNIAVANKKEEAQKVKRKNSKSVKK